MLSKFLTLGSGEAIARILYALAFVLLARSLGKVALGEFGFALTTASYLVLLVQQGFDQTAVREVARNPANLGIYMRQLFGLRLVLAIFVFSGALLYVEMRGVDDPQRRLLLVLALTCFFGAPASRWAFQLTGARHLAIATVGAQLIFFIGVLFVRDENGAYLAAAFLAAGEAAAAVYLLINLRRTPGGVLPRFSLSFWRPMAKDAWPVSVSALFGILVYNFDFLALGWLAGPAELGLYMACYRCVTVVSPLFSTLQISILPELAQVYTDRVRFVRSIRSALIPTVAASIAFALVLTVFPKEILVTVFGPEYAGGTIVLRVLAWSVPLQGIRSILRQALLASRLQKRDTANMFGAAVTSVTVDLLLIPKLGALASAIATGLVELMLVFSSFTALKTNWVKNKTSASRS